MPFVSERRAAGRGDSSDEQGGALLFGSLGFLKFSGKNAFVHYVRNKQMGRTRGKTECFHVLGFSHQGGAFWVWTGGGFPVVFASPLVVTVQLLPPIHGTRRLSWSRLALGLCVARAL